MQSSPKCAVWLVIPSYNDGERLARYLPELCQELEGAGQAVRLQVVDDGSAPAQRDRLRELVCEAQARHAFVQPPIFQEKNEGKGAAILRGWEAAGETAEWLGFLDADGAIPAREVRRLIGRLGSSAPSAPTALFASRVQLRGRVVNRSLRRHLLGRVFASMVGTWIDPHIYDSQCGFKLIPAAAWNKVRPLLREKRFAFDVELLAALNHHGCAVEEVPIDWTDIPGSKVSLLRDPLQMALSIKKIRERMREWAKP